MALVCAYWFGGCRVYVLLVDDDVDVEIGRGCVLRSLFVCLLLVGYVYRLGYPLLCFCVFVGGGGGAGGCLILFRFRWFGVSYMCCCGGGWCAYFV